ncbi:MAG TPA: MCE family protein, partial [Mycobacterium sp.]|nr:MCE family protein [Mycobacterium sp.]
MARRINKSRTSKIDPIWWAPALFILPAILIALAAGSFTGKFNTYIPLTLVSDRAGLVMEPGAKVKLRGVQIGQVATIATDVKAAQLQLKMDPGPFKYLPSDLEAEIKSTTAFGSKYVDLIVPEHPSRTPLKPGAVVHSRNVTVEVNTVFENLQSVLQVLDPAKLNAILSAFAQSVRGRGDRIGEAITDANNLLLTVNPRMGTIHKDWRLFGKAAAIYSDAAQDILSILDSATTTGTTLTDNQRSL